MAGLDFDSLLDMGFFHVLSSIYKPLKDGLDSGLGIDDFVDTVDYVQLDESDPSARVVSEISLVDRQSGSSGSISLAKFCYATACSFCGESCVYNKGEMSDDELECDECDGMDSCDSDLDIVDSCESTSNCNLSCGICQGLKAGGGFFLRGCKPVFSNIRDVLCKCQVYSGVDFFASHVGLTRYLCVKGITRNLTGVDVGSYSYVSPYFQVNVPSGLSVGFKDDIACRTSDLCNLSDILSESDVSFLTSGELDRIQDLYFDLGVNLAHRYQIYKLGYVEGFDGREVLRLLVSDFENLLSRVQFGFRVKVAFLTRVYEYLMDRSNHTNFEFVGNVVSSDSELIDFSFRFGGFYIGYHQGVGLTLVHKDGVWVDLWKDEPLFKRFEGILCYIYFSHVFRR